MISDERLKQLALLGCFVDDGCRSCESESMARELIQSREQNAKLVEALKIIQSVASGERQVAVDDTDGMAWIDKYAREALREAGAI